MLEGFKPIDLSLGLAIAPGQRHAGMHGVVVDPQALSEALVVGGRCGFLPATAMGQDGRGRDRGSGR